MSRSSVSIPLRILRSTYPELADAVVTDPVTGSKSVPLPAIPEEPDVYVAVQVPDFLSAVYGDLVEVVSPYLNEDACEAFANAANEALKLVFIESLANASWPRKTSALPTVAEQDEGVTRAPGSVYEQKETAPAVDIEDVPDVEKQTKSLQDERDSWYGGPNLPLEKELEACWKQAPVIDEHNPHIGTHTTNFEGMTILKGLDAVAKSAKVVVQSGHYGVKSHNNFNDEDYDEYGPSQLTIVGRVKSSLSEHPVTVGFAAAGSEAEQLNAASQTYPMRKRLGLV